MRRSRKLISGSVDQRREIASSDGAVSFVVVASPPGVYLERRERLARGSAAQHMLLFTDVSEFEAFIGSDPLRHTYPLIYEIVRREFDAAFDSLP